MKEDYNLEKINDMKRFNFISSRKTFFKSDKSDKKFAFIVVIK